MGLIQKGIKVVTLMDGRTYTEEGGTQDLILSIFVMARAHEESDTKAKRGLDDWRDKFAKARESRKPVGKAVAQKWLVLVDDGNDLAQVDQWLADTLGVAKPERKAA
jgi:hypothetical protein